MRRNFLAFASTVLLLISQARAATDPAPSALLTVSGPSIQPSGFPVIVTLSVYNNGHTPIGYWCGGPGEYPGANDFVASIKSANAAGLSADGIKLSNGQHIAGVGRLRRIVPGQTVRVPAVLPSLPLGTYDIFVRCDADGPTQDGVLRAVIWPKMQSVKPMRIEVCADAVFADMRDHEVIAGVRAADPFSAYLAATFPRPAVKKALADDLMAPSSITVERAMDGLWGDAAPAQSDLALVTKAMQQHQPPPQDDNVDFAMMERLIKAISPDHSTASQAAVAKVAAARTGRVHELAMTTLHEMRFPASITRRPTTPPPEQYDQEAILALIRLSRSLGVPERKLAFTLLADYPKSPLAVAAIRYGTTDPDPEVQATAHLSLNKVTPQGN